MFLTGLTEVHVRGLIGDITIQVDEEADGVDWQADAPMVAAVFGSPERGRLELSPKRGGRAEGKVGLIVAPGTCLRFTACHGSQSGPGDRCSRLSGAVQTFQA
jgi:hypothetical protein